MKEIKMLREEIKLLLENCDRAEEYIKKEDSMSHSLVIGELKHRCVALKSRLTSIQNLSTWELTRK